MSRPWESSRCPHSSNQFSFRFFSCQQTHPKQRMAASLWREMGASVTPGKKHCSEVRVDWSKQCATWLSPQKWQSVALLGPDCNKNCAQNIPKSLEDTSSGLELTLSVCRGATVLLDCHADKFGVGVNPFWCRGASVVRDGSRNGASVVPEHRSECAT